MYARTHAAFDPSRKLVAARRQTVHGHELNAGDAYPTDKKGEALVPEGTRRRLWVTHWATYSEDLRPTPVDETAKTAPGEQDPDITEDTAWMAEADGVSVTEGENGWYEVNASWLAEPEKAHGKDEAQAKAAELRETRGFSAAHKGGGRYEITGPGLAEPETVKGKDAAEARVAELRASPPSTPDDGSSSETEAGADTGE